VGNSPQLVDSATQSSISVPQNRLPSGQFAPGISGNPGGRPKRKPLTDLLRAACDDPKIAPTLVKGIIKAAQRTDKKAGPAAVSAFREIADRVEGPVVQESRQLVAAQIVIVSDMPEPEWDRD